MLKEVLIVDTVEYFCLLNKGDDNSVGLVAYFVFALDSAGSDMVSAIAIVHLGYFIIERVFPLAGLVVEHVCQIEEFLVLLHVL